MVAGRARSTALLDVHRWPPSRKRLSSTLVETIGECRFWPRDCGQVCSAVTSGRLCSWRKSRRSPTGGGRLCAAAGSVCPCRRFETMPPPSCGRDFGSFVRTRSPQFLIGNFVRKARAVVESRGEAYDWLFAKSQIEKKAPVLGMSIGVSDQGVKGEGLPPPLHFGTCLECTRNEHVRANTVCSTGIRANL
jgi:hypothetical protein